MALTFYLDEDCWDWGLVHALRGAGLDVLIPPDAGLVSRPDVEQLRFAASTARLLVSGNIQHFLALHSEWLSGGRSHAGMVLVAQQRYSIGERLRRLRLISERLSPEVMRDRVEFLSSWT